MVIYHKPPGIDQIPADFIKAGGRRFLSVITQRTNFLWNKEEKLEDWKVSIIVPISKVGDKTDCSNYRGITLRSITC
jgi:hypothetical protein